MRWGRRSGAVSGHCSWSSRCLKLLPAWDFCSTADHEILSIPRFQFGKRIEDSPPDLQKRWSDFDRPPVPQCAWADLTSIALGYARKLTCRRMTIAAAG